MELAIKNRAYTKKDWIISVFSITKPNRGRSDSKVYDYKLTKLNNSYAFYKDNNVISIDDIDATLPLFNLKDKVQVTKELCLNIVDPLESTYGRLLFNLIVLVECFGDKISFINKPTNVGFIEDIIADRLEDTPAKGMVRDHKKIYVDEYILFGNSLIYLSGIMQLCVWAETPKLMLAPPGIKEYKQKLIEQYKETINDPATIALIENKLVEFDAAYLKDDPGGEYFANNRKMRKVVRKKLFLMYGADAVGGDNIAKPVFNSLEEGWDISNFPQMNDALRAGSYSRGFETQLGGELSKWLLRASTNIRIQPEDCGTHLGFLTDINEDNYKGYSRLYYLDEKFNTIYIENEEHAKSLVGQSIYMRSPMYCKTIGSDYCQYCMGNRLSINPTALSSSVADFGSIILSATLANFHGKALTTKPFTLSLLS
jgi:hypothetical protein